MLKLAAEMKEPFNIFLLASTLALGRVLAHPCPYSWNIEFQEETKISGKDLTEFVANFNKALELESDGKFKDVVSFSIKPDSLTIVPKDCPRKVEKEHLIEKYREASKILRKAGAFRYGGLPIETTIPSDFPVACLLIMEMTQYGEDYQEGEEGAVLTIHRKLECRTYKLTDKFLGRVKEQIERGDVPNDSEPVGYTFASFGGLDRSMTLPIPIDPEKDEWGRMWKEVEIVDAVVKYFDEGREIIVLQAAAMHEEIGASMLKRGYIESTVTEENDE